MMDGVYQTNQVFFESNLVKYIWGKVTSVYTEKQKKLYF